MNARLAEEPSPFVIAIHKTARSTERYAHVADDARKVMADNVGEAIRVALDAQLTA